VLGNPTVQAVLTDIAAAPIEEPLRATLLFLRQVTLEHNDVVAGDVERLVALGVTRAQIESALEVAWVFNVITRLADAFEFHCGPQSAFDAGARFLLSRGYKL
jgi:hypothetical protein